MAGGELEEVDGLNTDPQFLNNIEDSNIREFTEKVIEIWPDLTRRYSGSGSNCTDCPNSFIPINNTFVVAGGRFREPYYWDSYWILEGLLLTGGDFIGVSREQIENFLDLVDQYGFVMNGARRYCTLPLRPFLPHQALSGPVRPCQGVLQVELRGFHVASMTRQTPAPSQENLKSGSG